MARTHTNSFFDQSRGRIGDIIVKTYKYGEVITRRPQMGVIPPSEKQRAQHEKWRAAAAYYRRVKADPALAACYASAVKKKGYPLSAITSRDFHRPPTVDSIELRHYRGRTGDLIEVGASDDVFVAAVHVTLRDAAGAEIESGPAVCEETYLPWRYRAKTDVNGRGPVTIEAVAQDLPGNRTMRAATWPGTTRPGATVISAPPGPSAPTTPEGIPPPAEPDPRAE